MKKQEQQNNNDERMPLGKRNYVWMLAGVVLVVVGFVLMSGGGSKNPDEFNEAMFSFHRITLAPIVILAGFAVVGVGIMKRFKR